MATLQTAVAGINGVFAAASCSGVSHARSASSVSSSGGASFSGRPLKHEFSCGWKKQTMVSRRANICKAQGGTGDMLGPNGKPLAPLVPESPVGQLLGTLLKDHPHLFTSAAEQQLESLADARKQSASSSGSSGSELVLYKRMAELRETERRKAVLEVMYMLILQRFLEVEVPLVPKLPQSQDVGDSTLRQSVTPMVLDVGPPMDKELESVHSPEALAMVHEHLAMVLGGRPSNPYMDQQTVAQISKMRVGQVYAASIMYGYFLRRVDQRFQLEKNMEGLEPKLTGEVAEASAVQRHPEAPADGDLNAEGLSLAQEVSAVFAARAAARGVGVGAVGEVNTLRAYVMSFDQETLARCAQIRSAESIQLMEKHTEALFGRPELIPLEGGVFVAKNDEVVRISLAGLRRVVLEAVAFGSFMWDVESHVDSRYSLVSSS